MRVIEPENLQPAFPRVATAGNVVFGVDQEPVRLPGNITSPDRLDHRIAAAYEKSAAFDRRRVPRVGEHVSQHVRRECCGQLSSDFVLPPGSCQSTSTVTAMPIPPPMQSDATP